MAVTPSSADEENDSSESASSVDEKEAVVITSVQNDVDKENVPTSQYSGWSLKQLKEECKAMALPCSGTKDTLIGRLEGRILAKPTGRRKGGIKENTIPSMSAADSKAILLDGQVLLVVIDIETTAHGLYSSDVIQLAARASYTHTQHRQLERGRQAKQKCSQSLSTRPRRMDCIDRLHLACIT